jgi:hypothetical protein
MKSPIGSIRIELVWVVISRAAKEGVIYKTKGILCCKRIIWNR